ncbi:hypothetical protein D3C80_2180970 [compost metagenome]
MLLQPTKFALGELGPEIVQEHSHTTSPALQDAGLLRFGNGLDRAIENAPETLVALGQ